MKNIYLYCVRCTDSFHLIILILYSFCRPPSWLHYKQIHHDPEFIKYCQSSLLFPSSCASKSPGECSPNKKPELGRGEWGVTELKEGRQFLPIICCVTLDKLLKLSEFQFPHLPNNGISHTDLFCVCNELPAKCFASRLKRGKKALILFLTISQPYFFNRLHYWCLTGFFHNMP